MARNRRQGLYWILTYSQALCPIQPKLLGNAGWIKGQLERGDGGFLHWQFILGFNQKASLRTIQELYPGCHAELTRSKAAEEYVWKEDTRIEGTQFEEGTKPFNRNSPKDWELIWDNAIKGDLLAIPAGNLVFF